MVKKSWFLPLLIFAAGAVYFIYRARLSSYGGLFDRDSVATLVLFGSAMLALDLLIAKKVVQKKGISGAILFFIIFFVIVFGILLAFRQ